MAELLYRDTGSPYHMSKRYGLKNWLTAQVRDFLTKGAWFCVELDLERSIRFNVAYLERRAEFVLKRRRKHWGKRPGAHALATVLGIKPIDSQCTCVEVWTTFLHRVADELVEATRDGWCEDLR